MVIFPDLANSKVIFPFFIIFQLVLAKIQVSKNTLDKV